MKKNTHPEYRDVLFEDTTGEVKFIIRSSAKTSRTIEHEGITYPYMRLEVSSESHSFYTGTQSTQHIADQVGKFQERYKFLSKATPSAE